MAGQEWMDQGDKRRREILKFIKAYHKKNGMAPTRQEIADGVGIYKNAVSYHITVMEQAGTIKTMPGRARSIRVVA